MPERHTERNFHNSVVCIPAVSPRSNCVTRSNHTNRIAHSLSVWWLNILIKRDFFSPSPSAALSSVHCLNHLEFSWSDGRIRTHRVYASFYKIDRWVTFGDGRVPLSGIPFGAAVASSILLLMYCARPWSLSCIEMALFIGPLRPV